ncbi:hypothetical protein M8C21_028155 [Ambrosia artemisiifolia]|uniref:Uncharacterized protein n=1 Tax=Ambrosia artemisiifolia TaxID=4212 RepID=A0AAD5G9U3_AMBAR|nr:hypothetical protein M8C21_028155 [Ambrosia artemisiifolia]
MDMCLLLNFIQGLPFFGFGLHRYDSSLHPVLQIMLDQIQLRMHLTMESRRRQVTYLCAPECVIGMMVNKYGGDSGPAKLHFLDGTSMSADHVIIQGDSPLFQILFEAEATHGTHYSTTHGAYFSELERKIWHVPTLSRHERKEKNKISSLFLAFKCLFLVLSSVVIIN